MKRILVLTTVLVLLHAAGFGEEPDFPALEKGDDNFTILTVDRIIIPETGVFVEVEVTVVEADTRAVLPNTTLRVGFDEGDDLEFESADGTFLFSLLAGSYILSAASDTEVSDDFRVQIEEGFEYSIVLPVGERSGIIVDPRLTCAARTSQDAGAMNIAGDVVAILCAMGLLFLMRSRVISLPRKSVRSV